MLFGQRSQKHQEPIEVLLRQPAELLGDEFALAHILSISFYGSSGAPANISNWVHDLKVGVFGWSGLALQN
jgi:hypothetical protein